MNDPFGGQNLQSSNPSPAPMPPPAPQPSSEPITGWAPAPTPAPAPEVAPLPPPMPAAPASPAGGSNPFEATPPPIPPVSGPMQPADGQAAMEPGQPKSSLPLIVVLVLLIGLGVVFFASWMGWIKLFGLEKLWGRNTATEEVTPTPASNTNINDAKRKEDLANLKTALKNYYTATQGYPVAVATEKTTEPASLKVLIPDYIASLPVDPLAPTYYYGYKSDGKTFELTSILEDKTDATGVTMGSNFLYIITDQTSESTSNGNQ